MTENNLIMAAISAQGDRKGFIPLGTILDRQVLPGPITKERLEDLQLWSALKALAVRGNALHPLTAKPGGDPPDRLISCGDRTWGAELTELTIEDVRGDLARVRMFGRQFQQRLRGQPKFAHLRGRVVMLNKRHEEPLPRDVSELVGELETALAEDRGVFAESDVTSGELKGCYDACGPFMVLVNAAGEDGEIQVTAATHSEVMREDALQAFERRVMEKDRSGNDLVIVTCGLPDKQGYVCPYDHAIYLTLCDVIAEGGKLLSRIPTHIRGGLVHLWDNNMMISWSEDGEALPWRET